MRVILQNLTKKYPSRSKKQPQDVIAVNNFSFEIPDGKLIGLLGPSGCGKSTTLNLLSALPESDFPVILSISSMKTIPSFSTAAR